MIVVFKKRTYVIWFDDDDMVKKMGIVIEG